MREEYTDKMKERKEALEEFFARKDYVPMKFKEIASLFRVPKPERGNLQSILSDLIKEGKLAETGEGRYERPDADILTGTFMATKKRFRISAYFRGHGRCIHTGGIYCYRF